MVTAICISWARRAFNALVIIFILFAAAAASAAEIDAEAYRQIYDEGDANSYVDNAWAAQLKLTSESGIFIAAQAEFTAVHYWHQRINDLRVYGAGIGYQYTPRRRYWITPSIWGMAGYYWPHASDCPLRRRYPEPKFCAGGIFGNFDYQIHSAPGLEVGIGLDRHIAGNLSVRATLAYRWLKMSETFSSKLSDGSTVVIDKDRDLGGSRIGLSLCYKF